MASFILRDLPMFKLFLKNVPIYLMVVSEIIFGTRNISTIFYIPVIDTLPPIPLILSILYKPRKLVSIHKPTLRYFLRVNLNSIIEPVFFFRLWKSKKNHSFRHHHHHLRRRRRKNTRFPRYH